MEIVQRLQKKGWFLTLDGVEDCKTSDQLNDDALIKSALDKDLRDIAAPTLSEFLSKSNSEICGPLVLQVQKVRNVSAPKVNEASQHAPQLLRVYLTDGHSYLSALQSGTWNSLSVDTAPGTKLLIKTGAIKLSSSFLFLTSNQFSILGGHVKSLMEKWLVNRSMVRNSNRENEGPPPWINFGQKITYSADIIKKSKMVSSESEPKDSKSNEAFDEQRKMNIAVISKSMDTSKKNFGKPVQDKIPDQKDNHYTNTSRPYQRSNEQQNFQGSDRKLLPEKLIFKETNNFDKNDKGFSGRNKRERRNFDSEEGPSSAPSKQSTLFDFLNMKLDLPEVPSNDKSTSYASNNEEHSKYYKKFQPNSSQNPRHNQIDNYKGGSAYDNGPRYQKYNGSESRQSYEGTRDRRNEDRRPNRRDNNYDETRNRVHKSALSSGGDGENYLANNLHFPVLGNEKPQSDSRTKNVDKRKPASVSSSNRSFYGSSRSETVQVDDIVMAKYWDDGKFYQALVHAISAGGQTCVVQFIEYGNFEEVLIEDIVSNAVLDEENASSGSARPQQAHNTSQRNSAFAGEGVLKVDFRGTLEFRRGGDKPYLQKDQKGPDSLPPSRSNSGNQESRRPRTSVQRLSANFYQPPPRRN